STTRTARSRTCFARFSRRERCAHESDPHPFRDGSGDAGTRGAGELWWWRRQRGGGCHEGRGSGNTRAGGPWLCRARETSRLEWRMGASGFRPAERSTADPARTTEAHAELRETVRHLPDEEPLDARHQLRLERDELRA